MVAVAALFVVQSASGRPVSPDSVAVSDMRRAIALLDNAMAKYYDTGSRRIAMSYNPASRKREGEVSVWEYTAAFEAANSVLEALEAIKTVAPRLYKARHDKAVALVGELYRGLQMYKGTFSLPSYTGRNTWTVYSVDRGASPADKNFKENVYDDQMWIMREDMRAYMLTGKSEYLEDAFSLARYVLDGWDCTLDNDGKEYGGITWGPGYTSKHACSNGPVVSSLAWLAREYGKGGKRISYYSLDKAGTRVSHEVSFRDYFLSFAKKVYGYHVGTFYNKANGLFWDMCGGKGDWTTRTIGGVEYRQHVDIGGCTGENFSYNTGSVISGGADLFRLTGDGAYLNDIRRFVSSATAGFTRRVTLDNGGKPVVLHLYHDKYGKEGMGNAWFNDVLIRSFIDANEADPTLGVEGLEYAQQNLDYAFENCLVDGLLPAALVGGSDRSIALQQEMAFISVYAQLAKYQSRKTHGKGLRDKRHGILK